MASRMQPKRNRGALSVDRIFNSTSPIVNNDIQAFLSLCIINWCNYSEEEKFSIIESLPPSYRQKTSDDQGVLLCPVTAEFVAQDRTIKDNVAAFQREVGEGYYTRTWQEKARKAMQERTQGKFDEYLRQNAEKMFGNGEVTGGDAEQASTDGEFGKYQKGSKRGKTKQKRKGKEEAKFIHVDRVEDNMGSL